MYPNMTQHNYLAPSGPRSNATLNPAKAPNEVRGGWLRNAYRRWQRRQMIAVFESLDDTILRDIGIRRGEIRSVVRGFSDQDLKTAPVLAAEVNRKD